MSVRQQRLQERRLKASRHFFLVLTISGPICWVLYFPIIPLIEFFIWGDSVPDPSTQIFLSVFHSFLLYGGFLLFTVGVLGLIGVSFYLYLYRVNIRRRPRKRLHSKEDFFV